MTDSVADYVGQRAELLARLVLTRRKDVRVFPLGDESDVGLDFIAHTTTPISGLPANPYFGVQVKGTANALDDERTANRLANQFVRDVPAKAFILAPIVLMVFSMAGLRRPPPPGSAAMKTVYQLPVQRSEATASSIRGMFPVTA